MAKNKIRVQSKSEYVIEVNDAGETISFDLADTSLSSRLFKMFEEVDRLQAEYDAKSKEIAARPDEPLYTIDTDEQSKTILTRNQKDGAELVERFYQDSRSALDIFLGQGACQKIFGDKNYLTMFDDLLLQLEPHIKKMGLDTAHFKDTVAGKYKLNRAQRRTLK